MPLVEFKDLCIDANDPVTLGGFWAEALGLRYEDHIDGDAVLRGVDPHQSVWINRVPESKSVKHRVHLDVKAPEVDFPDAPRLSEPGAFEWIVHTDPEGGEFCVFDTDPPADYRLFEVVIDAMDHEGIAAWWHGLWGGDLEHREHYSTISGAAGVPFDAVSFVPVPENKEVKNRIHWDVTLLDDTTVRMLKVAGAQVLREPTAADAWTVMADPEGNEFCVFDRVDA